METAASSILYDAFSYNHIPGDIVVPHVHKCYELNFFCDGEGDITWGDDSVPYHGPTLHLVAPDVRHYDKTARAGTVGCCLFMPSARYAFPSALIRVNARNAALFDVIRRSLFSLIDLWAEPRRRADEIETTLDTIVYTLSNVLGLDSADRNEYLSRVIDDAEAHIKKNFARKINFEVLAEGAGYSYDRFRHIFAQKTGSSLKSYQDKQRLSAAIDLLRTTRLRIETIAAKCGFRSAVRFFIWFKERMGLTPRQYRLILSKDNPAGMFNIRDVAKKQADDDRSA